MITKISALKKDGTQDEIIPGYKVEYTCGLRGPHTPPRVADVTSAQQCAKHCQDKPGCTGSSWSVKFSTCFVATGTGDVEPKEQQWYLYMKNVTPPPPPPVEETNQAVISRCDQLRDQCIQGFSGLKCEEGDGNQGGEEGDGNQGGEEQGNGEGVVATGGNPSSQCSGFNDRAVLTNKGQKYNLYCNKFDGPSSYLPGWGGIIVDSPQACIQACTDYPDKKCKRALWSKSSRPHCYLREWHNAPCEAKADSPAYDTANVIECA
ncbi:unnamed protein product [Penicillium bialowiezense]